MPSEIFGRKGTFESADLNLVKGCMISVVGIMDEPWQLKTMPEITDSKSANYNSQTVFGRSSPIRSYSDSGARTISVSFDLINTPIDEGANFEFLRAIAAAAHPQYDQGIAPPPLIKFQCGPLISGKLGAPQGVTCILSSYSFNFNKESTINDEMVPFKIGVSLELEVVYSQQTLPGAKDVMEGNF